MNLGSPRLKDYVCQIISFIFSYAWLALGSVKTRLKGMLTVPFSLALEWCCSNKHCSVIFPQDYLPTRDIIEVSYVTSFLFFSPTHSQSKQNDKGVRLTSRPLLAPSYRTLPPAKRTSTSLCCLWIFQVEHREKKMGNNLPLHSLGEEKRKKEKARK